MPPHHHPAFRRPASRPPLPSLCMQSNPRRGQCARYRGATAPYTSCAITTRCVVGCCWVLDAVRDKPGAAGQCWARDAPRQLARPRLKCLLACLRPLLPPVLQRYKICPYHLELPCLVVEGQTIRFCQQCGRFQLLSDFEGDRRSCRRKVCAGMLLGLVVGSRAAHCRHAAGVVRPQFLRPPASPLLPSLCLPYHTHVSARLLPSLRHSWTNTMSGGARRRQNRRRG